MELDKRKIVSKIKLSTGIENYHPLPPFINFIKCDSKILIERFDSKYCLYNVVEDEIKKTRETELETAYTIGMHLLKLFTKLPKMTKEDLSADCKKYYLSLREVTDTSKIFLRISKSKIIRNYNVNAFKNAVLNILEENIQFLNHLNIDKEDTRFPVLIGTLKLLKTSIEDGKYDLQRLLDFAIPDKTIIS